MIHVLIIWVIIFAITKGLHFENRGFEIKSYRLVYKNDKADALFLKITNRIKKGISIFANISIVTTFIAIGLIFWFLIENIANYFIAFSNFATLYLPIPGIFLTSMNGMVYFLIAVVVVLAIHKGSYGLVFALEKIKIKTGGFTICLGIIAGFIEPDKDEFSKAKAISKLRVIGTGATSIMLFSLVLGTILLTNPLFATTLGEPFLSTFYEPPKGILVLSTIENFGAEKAGLLENDIIVLINNIPTLDPSDFPVLNPGDTANITVIRDTQTLEFDVEIMASPGDSEHGLIGIMRDYGSPYTPKMNFIEWNDVGFSMLLLWVWKISTFIALINLLPLPFLDGGKFIRTIIYKKMSEQSAKTAINGIYVLTAVVFGLNVVLSQTQIGWFSI